jgi:sec-independent protein translocase protein TatC
MSKKASGEMTFLEHLEELRWHIIRSVVAIAVFAILAFIYSRYIFDYILFAPKNPEFFTYQVLCKLSDVLHLKTLCFKPPPFNVYNFDFAGQFKMDMMVALYSGLVVAAPVIFYEIWRFVSPALHEKERKNAQGAVLVISFLFFLGILFGFYVITPFSVNFLSSYNASSQIYNQASISSYLATVISITLASGLVFELPIVAFFLSKIGLLTPRFMIKYWRHAIVIILVIAAIITPPDVISQIMVSIPLVLLYWVSILISARVEKRREQKLHAG